MSTQKSANQLPFLLKAFRLVSILLVVAGAIFLILGYLGKSPFSFGYFSLVVALLLGLMSIPKLKGYIFTGWILICVTAAMFFPDAFIEWNGFRLEILIVPLTQLIMFGMGATLSIADFTRVVKSPWPVFLCALFQFSVMPVTGLLVAHLFGFEGEIAAGIVLIGSCSGGLASNLMTYLAKGNLALSVTMTFFSTMLAPIATPFLMETLAGKFVTIDAVKMMFSIFNMIIVPLLAGLVAHKILYGKEPWVRNVKNLILVVLAFTLLSVLAYFFSAYLGAISSGIVLGSALIAIITVIRLIMTFWLQRPDTWIDSFLPMLSMIGICIILTILIAQTHSVFMAVGALLLLAAMIHNAVGYTMGYWGSKASGILLGNIGYRLGYFSNPKPRISESESRTIAIEVGMQNGGMATGLAIDVLQSYVAALPANLFGTWMNISGSILANYWQQRPLKDMPEPGHQEHAVLPKINKPKQQEVN